MSDTCHNQSQCTNCRVPSEIDLQIDKVHKLLSISMLYRQYVKESISITDDRKARDRLLVRAIIETHKLAEMFK